jgi:hypothetical protein
VLLEIFETELAVLLLVWLDELDEPSSAVCAPHAVRNKNKEKQNQNFTGAIADIIF